VAPTRSLTLSLLILTAAGHGCSYDPAELSLEELEAIEAREQPIVNGSLDSGHPAVGLLYLKGVASCTATLIGSRTVLTAAHCVTDATAPPYTPIFPIAFATGPGKSSPMVMAETITVHPGYGAKIDLAVVRLKQAIKGVTPIPIAATPPHVGEAVTLVGYGYTSDKNAGSFGVKRKAHNTIGKVGASLISFYGASGQNGNICFGDSGGPALSLRGGQEVLVGVHSYGDGACGVAEHDVRTDTYLHWIGQQAKGDLVAGTSGQPGDSTPPEIAILSPTPHAQLATSFSVKLKASDDVALARVELHLDGARRYTKVQAPWTFSFLFDGVRGGSHTIRADAVDIAGRRSSALIQVRVGPSSGQQPATHSQTTTSGEVELGTGEDPMLLEGGCAVGRRAVPRSAWPVLVLLALVGLGRATRWWSRRGRSG
jgi:V8-like Glu-specific endopeptidase